MKKKNVKPGDIARVVAPFDIAGRGAIVKVIRPSNGKETLCGIEYEGGGSGWVCEGWVRWEGDRRHGPLVAIADNCLRRVDPGTGTDEILLKAGKPKANDLAPRPQLEFMR